jgi:hypothetical protein
MSLSLTKKATKKFPPMETGVYPARIVQIIDLGRHKKINLKTGEVEVYPDGNEKIASEVRITYELPTETVEVDGEEKPRWLGKDYTVSTHEKSGMYKILQATDPTVNDLSKLLGMPLMVEVGLTSGGNNKITNVSKLMKGMEVPELVNPSTVFDIDTWQEDVFNTLPPFVKEKIQAREE